ncbi:MAG TPA: hypothetical protein VG734_17395 [Lacunisphaera sp.]|nr:hypothetical protein [Lacunisphaera sp.]
MDAVTEASEVFAQTKTQGQVVASAVFSFAQGVEAQTREAISDSALLAQLVANKQVDVAADPVKWYTEYTKVLENLGWVLQEAAWNDYTTNGSAAEVHQKIIEVLGVVLVAGATALAIVTSALNALKAMKDDSPWITLFARESQKARMARFQIGVAENDSKGGVMVTMLGCLIEAENNITQVLFFKIKSANARFQANNAKFSMNVPALLEMSPAIRTKIRAYQADYLSSIKDL